MMAFPSATLPKGNDWLYEVKWDGVRALCFLDGKKVRLIGRSGKPMEARYCGAIPIAQHLNAKNAVLDGEIVAFDANGVPSFAEIQPRIGARPQNVAALSKTNPSPSSLSIFFIWMVTTFDKSLYSTQARAQLAHFHRGRAALFHHFPEGENLLQAAREKGLEGVVAKSASSRYESKRSNSWLKNGSSGAAGVCYLWPYRGGAEVFWFARAWRL